VTVGGRTDADGVPDRLADGVVDGVDVGVYLPVCLSQSEI
jgi:hypothetical protein